MLWSKSENMCGENSVTILLQYPVRKSICFVTTGCHSMIISLVSQWRYVPISDCEILNDVRVPSLLLQLAGLLCCIYALQFGLGVLCLYEQMLRVSACGARCTSHEYRKVTVNSNIAPVHSPPLDRPCVCSSSAFCLH
jgi:hypothetical protein